MPEVLYEEIIEVNERVVFKQDKCELNRGKSVVTGKTNEEVCTQNPMHFCKTFFLG